MKKIIILILFSSLIFSIGCRTAKQINKAIAPKDTTETISNKSGADSILLIQSAWKQFQKNYIDFKTFSAKIKVEIETSSGKQPDITAIVRIIKDSAIWMSLTATFLNIEVYRVLITKDSVKLLNKQNKEAQFRSIDYLQEVTEIPFNYKTLQDLLIGNPVFFNDSINSYRQVDKFILISSIGEYFKNLLTLSADTKQLLHSKLDDVDRTRSRTADITYDDYINYNGIYFSANRQVVVAEKNKMDLHLNYKQFEFNKELSVSFNIPRNYKRN